MVGAGNGSQPVDVSHRNQSSKIINEYRKKQNRMKKRRETKEDSHNYSECRKVAR